MTVRTAYGHRARVFDVVFSPESDMIVSTSEDSSARVWRTSDMSQAALLTGHTSEVMRAAWNHDGSLIATGVFRKVILCQLDEKRFRVRAPCNRCAQCRPQTCLPCAIRELLISHGFRERRHDCQVMADD